MRHEEDRFRPADVRLRLGVPGKESADALRPGGRWTLVDSFNRDGSLYIIAREPGTPPGGVAALTPREREIVVLIARGLTTKEVAYELGISDATVRVLVGRAAAKLGTTGRAALLDHPEVRRLRDEG